MFLLLVHGDLIHVFEEQFGDLYDSGQGVWSEFSKGVASMLSESVLAVASFKGEYTVIYSWASIFCLTIIDE
jgi:hypothetical protein